MKIPILRRFLAGMAAAFLLAGPAGADLVNVAPDGIAYTSGPLFANDPVGFLNNRDLGRQIHGVVAPTAPFFYSLDLTREIAPRKITLHARQDGCCPARLSNIRVSVHADAGGALGDEVWGADLLTGVGENAGSGAGAKVEVEVPDGQVGRWIRVLSLEDPVSEYALQMTEIEVQADVPPSEINRAPGSAVTANAPLYAGWNPAWLADGSRATLVHADVAPPAGLAYTINLGARVGLSRIRVWARQDGCCPGRLTNYRVTVHPDNNGAIGDPVWTADLHTDGSNPGSGIGSVDELLSELDPGGVFEGQYIRIESLDDPPGDYALQIAEVDAFGEFLGAGSILISQQPASTVAGAGTSARFAVVASVVNGDPAGLTYQWQRDGVDIEGATEAAYQTPLLLASADKSVYRCVVSYPGLGSVTSEPATLRIHLAYQTRVFTNRPLWGGGTIQSMVDNNRGGVFHGDQTIEPGFAYSINLELPVQIEELNIYPRQDGCCPERLRNIRVSIHNDNAGEMGDSVWSTDLFTDGSNAGSGAGRVVKLTADMDPAGLFAGQWIQILNIEDPVTPYALQMNEVEVLGSYLSALPLIRFAVEPADYSTVPGRTALFTPVAQVVNGDISLLTYQWTRDGVEIPGATSATYRTPPLTDSDLTALYRCVISYPGLADVASRGAQVVFDYNYAKGQPAFSNRPLWPNGNWNISQITDGNRTAVLHGDQLIDPGMAYSVNLGEDVPVDNIQIYPRQDGCCPERFANVEVSLHADNGGEVGEVNWVAQLFTEPGSNAGAAAGTVVTVRAEDGFGDFHGAWIRLSVLSDPIPPYSLQMTELEVYGVPRPRLIYGVLPAGLQLTWTEGSLEGAPGVSGPWEVVANAISPLTVSTTGGGQRYFRLRR